MVDVLHIRILVGVRETLDGLYHGDGIAEGLARHGSGRDLSDAIDAVDNAIRKLSKEVK